MDGYKYDSNDPHFNIIIMIILLHLRLAWTVIRLGRGDSFVQGRDCRVWSSHVCLGFWILAAGILHKISVATTGTQAHSCGQRLLAARTSLSLCGWKLGFEFHNWPKISSVGRRVWWLITCFWFKVFIISIVWFISWMLFSWSCWIVFRLKIWVILLSLLKHSMAI